MKKVSLKQQLFRYLSPTNQKRMSILMVGLKKKDRDNLYLSLLCDIRFGIMAKIKDSQLRMTYLMMRRIVINQIDENINFIEKNRVVEINEN